jgi:DNA polymerase-1
MIIGEAPGFREDEINKPFQGKSGKLLDQYLTEAGIKREDVYITNVCKCRPPNNRTPRPKEIKSCIHYLWDEMKKVKPKYILLLGATAMKGVLEISGVKEHHGEWIDVEGLQVMTTYHPSAILRNPSTSVSFKGDITKFAERVHGETTQKNDIEFLFCRTKRDLRVYFETLKNAKEHSYDVETIPDTEIVLCQASTILTWDGEIKNFFIPLAHPQSPFRKSWQKLMKMIVPYLERGQYRIKTDAQNGKFDDKKYRHNTGGNPYLDFDTMLASHLLDENNPHDLGYLSQTYCNAPAYKEDVDRKHLDKEPINKVAKYNVSDSYWTLILRHVLEKKLRSDERLWAIFKHITMPAARAFEKAEMRGMRIDRLQLAKMTNVALDTMWQKQQEIADAYLPKEYELETCVNCRRRDVQPGGRSQPCPYPDQVRAGFVCKKYMKPKGVKTFNFNSSQQMGWLLFEILGIEPVGYTDTGNPSTSEENLVYMEHPIIEMLLKYREWQKLWSTYLRPWAEQADENDRIFPSAKLHGTVTGRLSYSKPNPQTVPRNADIRSIMCSPPGWKFVEADYSQIELRGAAHVANERTMIRIYQTGGDIHVETACIITGKRPQDITKDERKKAKAVNFGFLYGMGWKKFIEYAKAKYGVTFTEEEAKRIRKDYFRKFRDLPAWHDRQRRIVKRLGYVRSPLGRKRRLPEVFSSEEGIRAEAERQSINSPVQAIPPDLTLFTMALMDKMPGMWEECYVVAQVHDALLFEVREDVVDKWCGIIKHTMENLPLKKYFGVEFMVPIVAEVSVGTAWGKGEEWNGN